MEKDLQQRAKLALERAWFGSVDGTPFLELAALVLKALKLNHDMGKTPDNTITALMFSDSGSCYVAYGFPYLPENPKPRDLGVYTFRVCPPMTKTRSINEVIDYVRRRETIITCKPAELPLLISLEQQFRTLDRWYAQDLVEETGGGFVNRVRLVGELLTPVFPEVFVDDPVLAMRLSQLESVRQVHESTGNEPSIQQTVLDAIAEEMKVRLVSIEGYGLVTAHYPSNTPAALAIMKYVEDRSLGDSKFTNILIHKVVATSMLSSPFIIGKNLDIKLDEGSISIKLCYRLRTEKDGQDPLSMNSYYFDLQ